MVPRLSRREAPTRPRVEGDREQEILGATLEILVEAGYDRLTMDAVATRARASKATLYRRWNGKATLVIDALMSQKAPLVAPVDTGSLRGDLLAMFTDGVTESRDATGRFYDPVARLPLVLGRRTRSAERLTPGQILDTLILDVRRHVGGRPKDDQAMLALHRSRTGHERLLPGKS